MVNENLNFNNIEDEEPGFDFKTIIMKLFIYWKWILLSIIVCLGCAYVYLQMQTPVYRVSGRIMIHDKLHKRRRHSPGCILYRLTRRRPLPRTFLH